MRVHRITLLGKTWMRVCLSLCVMYSLPSLSQPLISDHTCTDLGQIPDQWIEKVRQEIKIYYGHTSHGTQITTGLERIESQFGAKYNVAIDWSLPNEPGALCIRDRADTYDPGDFFPTVPAALEENPEINVVMYGWCGQPGTNDWQQLLDDYINDMQSLAKQYPDVTFIYMTGHAQERDCSGCNRSLFNSALRDSVRKNNWVLFDFADLDCWYNDEMATYTSPEWCTCVGDVPLQHPHYNGDEAGHTTFESCENKGKAFWWLLARVVGWETPLPVELVSFRAQLLGENIELSWITASETNNYGFEVQRSQDGVHFRKLGFVNGHGTVSDTNRYFFIDRQAKGERFFYRLKQINNDGSYEYSPVIEVTRGADSFRLNTNYPNPFNQSTRISYNLPAADDVVIDILDSSGRVVRTLFSGRQGRGGHDLSWNGKDGQGRPLPSGLYFCRLSAGDLVRLRKMLLIR